MTREEDMHTSHPLEGRGEEGMLKRWLVEVQRNQKLPRKVMKKRSLPKKTRLLQTVRLPRLTLPTYLWEGKKMKLWYRKTLDLLRKFTNSFVFTRLERKFQSI